MEKIHTVQESGGEIGDGTGGKKCPEIDRQFEEVEGRVREINGEAERQFSQIRNLINRLIGDRGMALGEKVRTIFREPGVTLFVVLTAIGAKIASIIEILGRVQDKISQYSVP